MPLPLARGLSDTSMAGMECYFAGPLFTDAERSWNAALVARLRAALPEHTWLVPQEFCAEADQAEGGPDYGWIYRSCKTHLDRAGLVLAILDGPDPDSGTAWEAGYAVAKGLPVVGLRTDWRPAEDGSANAMLSRSCRAVLTSTDDAVAWLVDYLDG